MKILLVSDSHGNNEALKQIANIHPDMDLYLHLGDSESDEYSILPFISAKGNCDFYPYFQDYFEIPTPYGNIIATHKPNDCLKYKNSNTKICLYGHTHKRKIEKKDNIVYINPGAISFSRDGNDLSYMIIRLEKNQIEYDFYTLS